MKKETIRGDEDRCMEEVVVREEDRREQQEKSEGGLSEDKAGNKERV